MTTNDDLDQIIAAAVLAALAAHGYTITPPRPAAAPPSGSPRSFTITLPWVPPVRLSPNRRASDRTTRRLRAESRDIAALAIRAELRGAPPPALTGPCRIVYGVHWPPGRRLQDTDNIKASYKGARDAFDREGVLADDRQIVADDVVQVCDGQGITVVTLTEMGEAA